MVFRCRVYRILPERRDDFDRLFLEHLLPIQQRAGAKLVARIVSDDGTRVVALWAYDSEAERERIVAAVRADPAQSAARAFRDSLSQPVYESVDEFTADSTVLLELTLLGMR